MTSTPSHARLLELIAERSTVLRSAIAGALDAPVPGCPEWTGRDLVAHVGEVQRSWAAVVAAGPADKPPAEEEIAEVEPSGDLLDWSERGTEMLLAALREAGPDRGAWTWWGEPACTGAIARHQVQEAAVHAWDAEETVGRAGALPAEIAIDGVDEFLSVELAISGGWPHDPGSVGLAAEDAPDLGWWVVLTAEGGRLERGEAGGDAVIRGEASDLVLGLYRRRGLDMLTVEGDRDLAKHFIGWFPTD
jgi:uncharacterized protein (TIGR03083 family)